MNCDANSLNMVITQQPGSDSHLTLRSVNRPVLFSVSGRKYHRQLTLPFSQCLRMSQEVENEVEEDREEQALDSFTCPDLAFMQTCVRETQKASSVLSKGFPLRLTAHLKQLGHCRKSQVLLYFFPSRLKTPAPS